MWAIRILSGEQRGQIIPLKPGTLTIGRAQNCTLHFNETGISKTHAQIETSPKGVVLVDRNSTNGTFVNGTKIRSKLLKEGDRFSLGDKMFDLIRHSIATLQTPPPLASVHQLHAHPSTSMTSSSPSENPNVAPRIQAIHDLPKFFRYYVERVMLPGVYKLADLVELKYVVLGIILALVVCVSTLSVIPMIRISKNSIEVESRRRSLTIATNLAERNERAVLQKLDSSLTTQEAQMEEGVKSLYILSNADGSVLAPSRLAGTFPSEPFIAQARRKDVVYVDQIDDSTIGASVPITYYSPERQTQEVAAYAIVIYDMGSLAIDDGRTMSLFFQTLFMAVLVALLAHYFLYRLIEYPFVRLNRHVDSALKNKTETITMKFQFAPLQNLISNINTALSRMAQGPTQDEMPLTAVHDRRAEAQNLLQILGAAALAISPNDQTIIGANSLFEAITGINAQSLVNMTIQDLPDQALQQNVSDLLLYLESQSSGIASDSIDFSGSNYEIFAHAIFGDHSVAYYIITIHPAEDVAGGYS